MLGTITLTVGQGDSAAVSQKEEEPEKMEDLQEEAEPQVNGEKEDQDSPAANDITPKEETPKEEKANEASEVGFKKVFKFVGFKFTVKKDKTEKTEPVQLLTVKKEEGEEKSLDVTEDAKGDESKTEAKAKVPEEQEVTKTADEPAGTESPSEKVNGDATEKVAQQTEPSEDVKPEKEVEKPAESPTSPLQEIQSPLKRFFTQGLFSSLKKKTPFKKTKEEEVTAEEKAVLVTVEEKHESEEKTEDAPAQEEESRPEEAAPEPQQEEPLAQEESKTSPLPETAPLVVIEQKEDEIKVEIEVAPKVTQEDDEKTSDFQNAVLEEPTEVTKEVESVEEHPVMKEESQESEATTESKTTEEHVPDTLEEQQKSEHPSPDDTPTAKTPETVTTEAEILSSQEKAKVQGSPLKKLFTGTGLKKLSGKKQKGKKENEAKLAESGENVIEQIQSSTESAEVQKSDSSPSSPEESTERFIGEEAQAETPGPDVEGDGATSDGERKRDGITPWASFKKLVTPKKRVKRPSESDKEDDANEKPKSATMSSTESSGSTEKPEEPKPSEEEQKMERSIEEPKKKVDTSVSWEALICVGSSKKRARKTSDSDDESPKIEEEAQNLGEESAKNKEAAVESPIASSQEADQEQLASSPDQAGSPSDGEGVSTWESFKRLVTPRRKAKLEDKPEESPAVTTEQIPSDSEAGKEESTFSLKKLIPGRRKKRSDAKPEQAPADEADKAVGSAEEDSDTPAVVPLSEYDTEQIDATVKIEATAEVKPEQQEETQTVEIKPLESTHETQQLSELEKSGDTVPSADQHIQDIQVSVEKAIPDMDERSPSWISATVTEEIIQEQIESISKHQPLSDIPEEVAVEETTITRSPTEVEDHISPDDTIAQDIMELTSEAVTALEQAPEESFAEETTEMVSAVSRLTESPGTSGDATPVPGVYEVKQTDKILQEVAENIKLTPIALSVTNTTEQPEETVVVTVPHLMASAVKEDPIVMQKEAEAVAICTGLSTQEIEAVETNLQKSTVEVITLVMEAISTEVVAEEKTETFQEAGAVEEEVCNAEVQDIKTEYQEVEQQAETGERVEEKELQEDKASQQDGEIGKVSLETETDSELQKEVCKAPKESETEKESGEQAGTLEEIIEPESLQPITVSGQQDECEHEDQEVVELTPELEPAEGPAVERVEELICTTPVEVTETLVTVEEKLQEFKEVKDLADLEVPADEVIQCAAQEVVASIPEAPTSESSEMKEASFAVSAPAVEPEVPAVQKEEELICASSVEVTETSVIEEERVQEFKEVKDLADLQVPVENVIQCAAQEVVASMPEALTSESSETKEAPFAVSAPAIEAPVVKETVGILKPPCKTIKSEVAEVKTEDLVLRERVSSVKFKDQQETPFQDQHTIDEAATLLVEAAIGAVTGSLAEEKDEKSELGAQLFSVPEKSDNEDETGVCEKQGETGDVTCEQVEMHERVIETIVIEKQSTMIVQQIIQNVVENLTEKVSESQCDIAVARDHKEKEQITTEESSSTSDITELEKISEPQPAAEIISVCEETEAPPAEAEDEKLPEDTLVETETELVSESTAETNAKEDSEISGEKAFEDKDGEGEQKTETAEQAAVTKKEITEEDNEKSEGVEVPEELQISAIPETEHLTAGSAEEIQKSKETESTLLEEKCQDVDAEVKSEKITVEIAEMKSQETEVKMQEEVVEIQGGNVMRQEVEEVIVQEVTEQVECLEDGSQEENDVVKEHKTEEDAECEAIQTKSVEKESCTAEKVECQEEKEQAEMPTLLEEDSQRKAESEDILQKQEEVKREEEAQEKVFEDGKAQQEVDEDVQGAQTETQVSKVSKSQKEVVDVTFSQDNKVEEKSQQPVSEEVQHETSITDVQSQETMVKDALGQVEMKEDIPKQEKKPDVKSENTDKEALQEKPEVVDVQNQSAEAVDLQSPIESTVSQEQVMKDKLSIDNETENVQETVVDSESYKQQAGNAQIQTDETEAVAIQNQAITEESQKEIVEEVQIETAGAVDNKTEELPVKDDVQQDVAKTDVKTEKLVEDTEIDPPVVKDKQIEKDSTSGVSHDASIDAQGQKTLQCDVSAVEDLSCQTEIKEELQAQKDLVEDAKSLETAREDDICQKATLESVQTESVSKEVTESPTEAIEETRSTVLVDGETVSKADVVQDQMLSSESEQSTVDVVEDVQIQAETSEKTEVKQDEPKEELETEITQEAEKETEQVSSEHTAAS
nr:PREDICTED: A-kinase anchor protein 12 isoform X4 [Lepisosteus oculatus]